VENEMPVYNPLLIYGGSGLGKTHLIQATGNAIVEKYPYKKVFYSTSEVMYFFWMIYSFSRRFSEKVEELSRKSFFIPSTSCRNLENR